MVEFLFDQVIVVGGTGQTGLRLLELLVEHPDVKLVATSRSAQAGTKWGERVQWRMLDLEVDSSQLAQQLEGLGAGLAAGKRTALIFAAAFTNVEACEADTARCRRVNELNTIAVMKWAQDRFNAIVAFYSTDYVFDGAAGPYAETAPRHAISAYGRSKVVVEEWLEKNAPRALILRTTGVYDYLPGAMNFLMQMLTQWGQGKATRVPIDQLGNPIWAHELARATFELLADEASGIYHVAGATQLARTDFARLIAQIFGYDAKLIQPVNTRELGQKALRPLNGGLVCEKLKRELGWTPAGALTVLEALLKIKNGSQTTDV